MSLGVFFFVIIKFPCIFGTTCCSRMLAACQQQVAHYLITRGKMIGCQIVRLSAPSRARWHCELKTALVKYVKVLLITRFQEWMRGLSEFEYGNGNGRRGQFGRVCVDGSFSCFAERELRAFLRFFFRRLGAEARHGGSTRAKNVPYSTSCVMDRVTIATHDRRHFYDIGQRLIKHW